MRTKDEKGTALILSLFLTLVASVISASLIFLAQTETWSSTNYRLMSQARYGAESGLSKAANFLEYSYVKPGTGADPLANYDMTVSPVTFNGQPVVLSANASTPSNYPVAAVQAAFNTAARGTLPIGNINVQYAPYATLLSMQVVGTDTIQRWLITSDGTITSGTRTAQVQVSGLFDQEVTPLYRYAAFATFNGCDALDFAGGATTNSYDSSDLAAGFQAWGGSVGTNGNLTEAGNPTTINGSLSTPRTGVGACTTGNVTAWTQNGNAHLNGGIIELPQTVAYPAVPAPNPLPPTTAFNGNNQTLLNGASVGNITVNANKTLTLGASAVTSHLTINSLTLTGNGTVNILGTVILNVAGQGQATPIDLTGGGVTNAALDPSTFQMLYGGTGNVKLVGGSESAMVVYAPSATVSLSGNTDFYGAVIANKVAGTGGMDIHYDRSLQKKIMSAANHTLSSFTWKKSE